MKKALFVANLDSFHKNFHIPHIKRLMEKGYEVELVSTGNEDFSEIARKHDIIFGRSPFELQNVSAFREFRRLIKLTYYDIIYFSTPVIGAVGRIALIGLNCGRIIYSAHGYSFYKGNNKFNNLLYIIIEKLLCYFTDVTFTMNKEDYEACISHRFPCREIYNVDGVGVNLTKYSKVTQDEKIVLREKYNYSIDDFLLIYPAEFTERKNQVLLLETMAIIRKKHENVKLLLLGRGIMEDVYKKLSIDLGVNDYVRFLGYRRDVNQLLKVSDVLFASSKTEGLPINIIEALATGLPVVATNTRGQNDLIVEGYNGFLYELNQPMLAAEKICSLIEDKVLYNKISLQAVESSAKYDIQVVAPQYDKIFSV